MKATSAKPQPDLAAEFQRLFDGIEERPVSEREPLKARAADELARIRSAVLDPDQGRCAVRPEFEVLDEDRYRLAFPAFGVTFTLDHVRRERNALQGELAVECSLPGVRTFDGTLMVGDFNLSGPRSRQERARQLTARAKTGDEIDWEGMLEELCQRVLAAERSGRPTVSLREVAILRPRTISILTAWRCWLDTRLASSATAALSKATSPSTSPADSRSAACA